METKPPSLPVKQLQKIILSQRPGRQPLLQAPKEQV